MIIITIWDILTIIIIFIAIVMCMQYFTIFQKRNENKKQEK